MTPWHCHGVILEKNMNKKIKIISITIISICAVYSLFWNICISKPFQVYIDKLGGIWDGTMYVLQEEEYTYSIVPPRFPGFTGNLAISQNLTIEEDGSAEDTVSMLIWLLPKHQLEIGISVEASVNNGNEYHVERTQEDFYVGEDMRLISPTDEHTRQIYQEKYEEIQNLYTMAYKKWGILNQGS